VALAWSALLAAATILALELTGAGHLAPPVAVWTAGAGVGTVVALAQWPARVGAATTPSETARFA
jgi:hypothetical protein